MKYTPVFLIVATFALATTSIVDLASTGRGKDFMDAMHPLTTPHRLLPKQYRGQIVAVDSSGSGYSMWTQMHECLAYKPEVQGLQFVNRNYSPTGVLNAHQTDNQFSFWVDDMGVYNEDLGAPRYPHSLAGNDPYICFPYLDPTPNWGGVGIIHEDGGWFSSFWGTPIDFGLYEVHKVIGHQFPNGNIYLITISVDNEIRWFHLTYDLTLLDMGVLDTLYYWGFDINGNTAYIFGYDDSLNVYYYITTDTTGWSGPFIYDLVWPEPYANNLLFWTQMAVNDSGTPFLIFDLLNNNDYNNGTYPYEGKVYVSVTEGQPCVEVSAGLERNFWPTIAAEENYTVALFHSARDTSGTDSLCWWDLYYAMSTDYGETWSSPQNITPDLTIRPGLAQIAKRLDATTGRFFYVYGTNMVCNYDPIWHVWRDPQGLDPHLWWVGLQDLDVGVTEQTQQHPKTFKINLLVTPNPFRTQCVLKIQTPNPKSQNYLNIYNAAGRMVKSFDLCNLLESVSSVCWNGIDQAGQSLPAGVYFVELKTDNDVLSQKIIKLK